MTHADLSILPLDHPGANDPTYRARRDVIAKAAVDFRAQGGDLPLMDYTQEECDTWRTAVNNLAPLHAQYACHEYLEARERLRITANHIPQLRTLSKELSDIQNFKLEPIEGLIEPRIFLSRLADRTMLCTQYIRHASRPDYTPEPDIIHEVIGHVPTFTDPHTTTFSEHVGALAKRADAQQLQELERLYWFSLEFGLIQEDKDVKAFGAGLLSSSGELQHAFSNKVTWKPFTVDEVIRTPYDFSHMQSTYFIIPSFAALRKMIEAHFSLH